MMRCGKKIWGCFLGILLIVGIGCAYKVVAGADSTVTMTAFVEEAAARKAAGEGAVVTISNLGEFRLFQKELERSTNGLEGFSFRQEADITPGDYHFTYDQDFDRFRIYRGTDAIGLLDRNGVLYETDNSRSSVAALGLSDLILQTWEDARWFAGNYDGQGHYFRGFMLGMIDGGGSSFGGLFCDLGGGTIANVNVSDCAMIHSMTPIVNAMRSGEIINCHVSKIVGAAECCGGIAGLLWNGSIKDCTARECTYMFDGRYGEGGTYGGLGGIVGVIEQNSGGLISNCRTEKMLLYGAEYTQVGTGGIVGVANTSVSEDIRITNCQAETEMRNSAASGGIVGKVQEERSVSQGTSFILENCSCSGMIKDKKMSSGSHFGGIVGYLDSGVSHFKIENCVSRMQMEKTTAKTSSAGTMGGVIGMAKESFVADGAVFAGSIRQAGTEGQKNIAGGIAGKILAGGSVANCANFGNVLLGKDVDSTSGGLVGQISSDSSVSVVNSINAGGVMGKLAGGLAGEIRKGDVSHKLHNNLSLGKVSGKTMGMLAGDVAQAEISYCFQRREMSEAFGSGYEGWENCGMVSESQLAGTETSVPIFGEGNDQGICQLVEVLNGQSNALEYRKLYDSWENTQAGYPFFTGMEAVLSLVLPSLPVDDGGDDFPEMPMPTPGGDGTNTPTPIPGGDGTNTPTPIPGGDGTNTPTPIPGENGTSTPTPIPGGDGTNTSAPTPGGDAPNTSAPAAGENDAPGKKPSSSGGNEKLSVTGFSARAVNSRRVSLTWKNVSGDGVMIFRSEKKKSGYRKIRQCGKKGRTYMDKTCKPGKKYYYQVRAYASEGGKIRLGAGKVKRVKMPWLKTPAFRLLRVKDRGGQKYLEIRLKKYQGKYVDIYLKKQGGRYLKASMKSHKISIYRGKIRFTYSKSGAKYSCKLRTYRIRKGRKQYSGYSSVRTIRL